MAYTNAVEVERQRQLARVNNERANNGFADSSIRTTEMSNLEVGDEIHIEFDDKDVINQKLGAGVAQYIVVETKAGKLRNFYPSSLGKIVTEYHNEGSEESPVLVAGDRKFGEGTANKKYREFATMKEAMNFFNNKTIKVTGATPVVTKVWDKEELRNTNVLTVELVEG